MKILFIDDTLDTRALYEAVFRTAGHEVHLGTNGLEAVEALLVEEFDVVVTDLSMPLMDGWNAIRLIRLLDNGVTMPIILFTAYGHEAVNAIAEASGVDLILHKPMLPLELLEQIKNLVEAHKPIPVTDRG